MHKPFLTLGAFFGCAAVALGAFGAHGLRKIAPPETVAIFQTAVQYQMYHTLALLIVSIIYERQPNKWVKWTGFLFSSGILFFSGSLYLITWLETQGRVVPTAIGLLTPFGGLLFIAGWLFLLIGVMAKR